MGDPLAYVDQININTKNFPPVTHLIEIAPHKGERIVKICRCWQSKKFPYCDDSHKVLVEAGDNVGPFIAKLKGANPDATLHLNPKQNPVQNVSAAKAFFKPRGVFFSASLCLSAIAGYHTASLIKQWWMTAASASKYRRLLQ